MIKTIKLTKQDVAELLIQLGMAAGMGQSHRLANRILVQLGADNYVYGERREDVEASLAKDGIDFPKET